MICLLLANPHLSDISVIHVESSAELQVAFTEEGQSYASSYEFYCQGNLMAIARWTIYGRSEKQRKESICYWCTGRVRGWQHNLVFGIV